MNVAGTQRPGVAIALRSAWIQCTLHIEILRPLTVANLHGRVQLAAH